MILLWLALRELRRSWRFSLFFIFNLSLGLAGFVALQTFNSALVDEIKINAKSILSGDLTVSSRRELTNEEIQALHEILPKGTSEGKVYEFFAMLSADSRSRLVLVKAVDQTYPFYGQLQLQSAQQIEKGSEQIIGQKNVWIYPEIQTQMGFNPGDKVQLGQLKLKIADVVSKDQTQTFRAASMAPRIFIDRALLRESGLIQFGSTFTASYVFKLPSDTDEELLKQEIYKKLKDPQISVDTPKTAGESAGRQLGYLSDYLGLVALIALFMSALGASYIYRLFLTSRMKEIAILRTLGLQSEQAVGVYVLQATLLGIFSTFPAMLFSELVLPFLTKLLATFSPFTLQPRLNMETFGLCLLMAVVGCFVLSLPFLVKIFNLKAAKLFSEEKFAGSDFGGFKIWPYLPAVFLFLLLSVYQAHSWKIGSIFVGVLALVILILLAVGYVVIKSAKLFQNFNHWVIRFSFLSLSRRAISSLAIFVSLGVGALLINILPQLKNSLQADFNVESKSGGKAKTPALFLFDIQDEQLNAVQEILTENQVEPLAISPMVRARISTVNGQEYERKIEAGGFKTREEETDARFRNRGVNLSYREKLSSSEEITQGRPITANFDLTKQKYAELSVEQGFADRMNFRINDILVFDVQGIQVEGQIVNFRKVKWTSFQPNFFILVQNGVLNEAPKTFIAAIPSMDSEKREHLQTEISKKISNVSVIDVVRLVEEILSTADRMSWSLELMAYLALITGYIVLFSIVRSQIKLRRWELNMLKILGASQASVSGFILTEFAFLSFLSSLFGALLSIVASYLLNRVMFEGNFVFSWVEPMLSVLAITGLSLVISFLASQDIVKESALGILRQEG